jgi:hypothetical protein
MKIFLPLLLMSISAQAATLLTNAPVLTPAQLADLQAKRVANTAEWVGAKAYVDGGTVNSTHDRALVASYIYAGGGGDTYCTAKAIPWMINVINLQARKNVISATNSNPVTITLDADHGIAVGSSRKMMIYGPNGSTWTPIFGEMDWTATGARTLTRSDKNSTTFGTFPSPVYIFDSIGQLDFGADDQRGTWWKVAIAYRICRPLMTTQDATNIRIHLESLLEHAFVYGYNGYYGDALGDEWWPGNLPTTKLYVIALASAALHGEYSRSQTIWDANRNFLLTKIVQKMSTGFIRGGGATEGTEYEPQSLVLITGAINVTKAATGEDILATAGETQWHIDAANQQFHMTSPSEMVGTTTYMPMPNGDFQGSKADFLYTTRTWGVQLWWQLKQMGQTALAAKLKGYLDVVKPKYTSSADPGISWAYEIWFDKTDTSADWRTGPTNLLTVGMGRAYMRSSWASDATWVTTNCGFPSNHVHSDCGQIQIWRKGHWLTSERVGYYQPSNGPAFHSIFTPGGIWPNYPSSGSSSNSYPAVTALSSGTLGAVPYAYAKHDMTGIYKHRSDTNLVVNTVQRQALYLKPDTVIVADYVKFNSGYSRTAFQNWTFSADPVVSGQRITHTTGTQKLYVDSVFPTTANVSKTIIDDRTYVTYATRSNPVKLYFEHQHSSPTNLVGAAGEWTVLNGSKTRTEAGNSHIYTVPVNTSALTTPYCAGVNWGYQATSNTNTYVRGIIATCTEALEHTLVSVLRGDEAANTAPSAPTARTATNAYALQMGDDVVIVPTSTDGTPTLPITATFSLTSETRIYVMRMGAGTSYACDTTTTPGEITISAGTGCSADSNGLITRSATSGGAAVTLAASVASVSFSGVVGGSNPASQTFSVTASGTTTSATVDRLVKIGSDCAWLTASPTGGSTPQTITLAVSLSGVTEGHKTCSVQVESDTAGVLNSPTVGVSLTVAPASGSPLDIGPDQLWTVVVSGASSSVQLYATGGTPPYTFSKIAGTPPSGLTLDTSTGLYSGVPVGIGDYTAVTLRVTDSAGATADHDVRFRVLPASTGLSVRKVTALPTQMTVEFSGANEANVTCLVVARDVGGDTISEVTVPRGPKVRSAVVGGLNPNETVSLDIGCQTRGAQVPPITLPSAAVGNFTFDIAVAANGADNIVVDYGPADNSLTNTSAEAPCVSGVCTATITVARGAVWYYQVKRRDASDATIRTGPIRRIEVE